MDVTFLIGNGFDLACGLKTSYTDFLDYYFSLPSQNRNIDFFKGIMKQDIETWADAEIAFGEYTKRYKPENVKDFLECRDDFIKQLLEYLRIRESFIGNNDVLKEAMPVLLKGLINFDSSLPDSSIDCLVDVYNSTPSDALCERKISILTFNYTSLFEKILLPGISDSGFISFSKLPNGNQCKNTLDAYIYVHGRRDHPPVIFGVDNESQISNSELLKLPRFVRSLIKPELNNILHKKQVDRCTNIVNSSSIICIYGMSIGLTDTIWWKKIVEWLHIDQAHQLIYYAWVPSCIKASAGAYVDSLDECRDQLYEKFFLSKEDSKKLRDQIHIEINVDLFGVSKTIRPSVEEIIDRTYLPINNIKSKARS